MTRPELHRNVLRQRQRISDLESINRQRALTSSETDELARLIQAEKLRRRRAPAQLAAARARVARLEAVLA